MGRDATVDYNDVAIAANKIKAAGSKPTVRSVRDEIGRGSQATVHTHFKQWQKDQSVHDPIVDVELMDPLIARAINLLIATKVQEATADITSKLLEEQSSCDSIIKEYALQSDDIKAKDAELSALVSQYANLTGRSELLEADVAHKVIELNNERKASDLVRTELAIAKKQLESLPRLESELDQAHAALQDARAEAEAAVNSEASAVGKAKIEAQHAYLLSRVAQLESDVARTANELSIECQMGESIRTELAVTKKTLENLPRLDDELEKIRAELQVAKEKAASHSEAAAVAQARYESEIERRKSA